MKGEVLFMAGGRECRQLARIDMPRLQVFFEANPEYFETVEGAPPGPHAAEQEFDSGLPDAWPHGARRMLEFAPQDGPVEAMADIVEDLFAAGVWHVGLFIVATRLHGSGASGEIYGALESWMQRRGARWVRLGVVAANERAGAFWRKIGFGELRRRTGVPVGERVHEIVVMMKSLQGGDAASYLACVPRDRPESP